MVGWLLRRRQESLYEASATKKHLTILQNFHFAGFTEYTQLSPLWVYKQRQCLAETVAEKTAPFWYFVISAFLWLV